MFGAWFRKTKRKSETRRESFVPCVEGMEDRLVPSAVRIVAGFNANTLPAAYNSSHLANLGFQINFYGDKTSSVTVNEAGIVRFSAPVPFGPPISTALPKALGQGIIAPFWAGVDTSKAGTVTYGTGVLEGFQAFAVTWSGVGYFNGEKTPLNSFQMVIISRPDTGPGNFDLEFNYDNVLWDSSDNMGGKNGLAAGTTPRGTAASVGFSAGTGVAGTFFILPGSHASGKDLFVDSGSDALVKHDLNATTPGRYHFYFRNGRRVAGVAVNVSTYMPFRYVYNASSQEFLGNLTLVNHTQSVQNLIKPQANLDEVGLTQPSGPVTVEFTQLPQGVVLANESGVAASGHPYITINTSLGIGATFRIALAFRDPLGLPLPDFYDATGIEVFLGGFNPSQH